MVSVLGIGQRALANEATAMTTESAGLGFMLKNRDEGKPWNDRKQRMGIRFPQDSRSLRFRTSFKQSIYISATLLRHGTV